MNKQADVPKYVWALDYISLSMRRGQSIKRYYHLHFFSNFSSLYKTNGFQPIVALTLLWVLNTAELLKKPTLIQRSDISWKY